jgi:hypothetical protein
MRHQRRRPYSLDLGLPHLNYEHTGKNPPRRNQSGDSTALRPIASSKLRRTTYEPFDSAEDPNSGEAIATFAPNRYAPEPSDLVQRRESREALTNSRPNRQASEVSNAASAAIAVRLSQPLNRTLGLRASLISLAPQSRLSSCNLYAELGSLQTSRFRSESRQRLRNREL